MTLPSDISAYINATITRELTPPTSNSNGSFSYTSSNTAVATITNNSGVYSINVIGVGSTVITATQASSGVYGELSTTSPLVVTLLYPTFGTFTLPSDLIYTSQTITRQLTSPTSNSNGSFSYTSSNTAVATITNNAGVYSINVIGGGYTTITVTQAASGDYNPLSTSVIISTITGDIGFKKGFSVITNRDFISLDFNTGMTTLFTLTDSISVGITIPNSNFKFNNAVYSNVYLSSKGALYFGITQAEYSYGTNAQTPINSFRFFGDDHISTGSYKFDSNNTRLLINLTGYKYGYTTKTFTIKLIIDQAGVIQMNYTIASTYTEDAMVIGYVGSNNAVTTDDIFLTLNGFIFNHASSLNLYSLLNGKTILYI